MTVRVSKPKFNLREKITELDKPSGVKGNELLRSETTQEARDIIGAGRKNRVINGAMLINFRANSYTSTNEYLLDRFNHRTGSGFSFDTTTTQSTSAPDGFTKSLKITPDSTQTPTGSHNGMIAQLIEADNLLGFASGTSSAKSFALSFYAKSSSQNNNHQYSVQISKVNSGGTYYYQNRSFVVTSSWQRFTVVFPADTSNNIATGNGEGLRILWHLSAGPSDIANAVTSWTSSNGNHAVTGQSNFMDNTSNEFYLTGVQLEVGENVTEFEHRSPVEELALCQRYFFNVKGDTNHRSGIPGFANSTTNMRAMVQFPVPMRVSPSVSGTSTAMVFDSHDDSASFNCSSLTAGGSLTNASPHMMVIEVNTSGMTNGQAGVLEFRADNGSINFDAEL